MAPPGKILIVTCLKTSIDLPESGFITLRTEFGSSQQGENDVADIDALIIGAGVIGLSVARALSLRGQSVIVIEREDAFGSATSSRSSEVIHAGLYYPAGSAKAKTCVDGRHKLYAFCQSHGVAIDNAAN